MSCHIWKKIRCHFAIFKGTDKTSTQKTVNSCTEIWQALFSKMTNTLSKMASSQQLEDGPEDAVISLFVSLHACDLAWNRSDFVFIRCFVRSCRCFPITLSTSASLATSVNIRCAIFEIGASSRVIEALSQSRSRPLDRKSAHVAGKFGVSDWH